MESLFQYRRIQRAVAQEVAAIEKCTCDGEHGPSCNSPISQIPDAVSRDGTDISPIIVTWSSPDDKLNPANWCTTRKIAMTGLVSLIGLSVTAASAIDACGLPQYTEELNASEVVGSLATGLFMIGFGFGSIISGPFSEVLGRNMVYLITMIIYLLFIMAAGLAPNIHSHLIFRFFAGIFGSTPLTCSGGTIADLWDPVQKGYAFTIYAVPAFGGPVFGQLIGSFIPPTLGWRWLEWIMLITGGTVLAIIICFQPETYGALLLQWKAKALRQQTGNRRYMAPSEISTEPFTMRMAKAIYRPFLWSYTELIVLLMSLYLTIVYIILFTFLEGYIYIFGRTYGLSQGLTSITWAGMLVGMFLVIFTTMVVYSWTKDEYKRTSRIRPEMRLWYAMLGGAPAVPIGLFWMGWTAYPHISIWSPLVASVLVGYGMTTIFISAYLYIIDSYDVYASSSLGFMAFVRYLTSGGVMIAGSTIYQKYGVHNTLSVLGAVSAAMAFIPYLFYFYGPAIRRRSKNAAIKD